MIKRVILKVCPVGKDGNFVTFSKGCAWRAAYFYIPFPRNWAFRPRTPEQSMPGYWIWWKWAHVGVDPDHAKYRGGNPSPPVCVYRGPALFGSLFNRRFTVRLPHVPWRWVVRSKYSPSVTALYGWSKKFWSRVDGRHRG